MNYRIAALAGAAMLAGSFSLEARADDLTDQLDAAKAAYGKHDLRGAQRALDTAATLLRQQRLTLWKTVLPDALDGWKADNIEGAAAAMAMLGGGVSVSRRYRRGSASVTIEIITDSPIIASVATFMNGMLSLGGGELVMIDGHKTNYRADEHSYTTLVADKAMITVKGAGGVGNDDLRAYVKAIRFAAIEKLLN